VPKRESSTKRNQNQRPTCPNVDPRPKESKPAPNAPKRGSIKTSAQRAQTWILDQKILDFEPRLNTSSYVNVFLEPEEKLIATEGLKVLHQVRIFGMNPHTF